MAAMQLNTPNPPVETASRLRLEDLSVLDRRAFNLAFQEEVDAADPNEPAVYAYRRAMLRVERFLATGRPPGVRELAARNDAVPFGQDGRALPSTAMERAT